MIATAPDSSMAATGRRAGPLAAGRALLAAHCRADPTTRYGVSERDLTALRDATATALMDLYRSVRSGEAYEALVEVVRPSLERRVRTRVRTLGAPLAEDEVLQDVLINIYRYPDRFDAARAGAFRAWSSTIVDNTIRRQLRGLRRGPEVHLRPIEILSCEADARGREPDARAQANEACRDAFRALRFFLALYMVAYENLSERERFVLHRVEVRGMRYAPLAAELGIRPEALKMVVFRARRRIADRIEQMLARQAL